MAIPEARDEGQLRVPAAAPRRAVRTGAPARRGGRERLRRDNAAPGLARGLGWFSIALGLAELMAPDGLARLIGVDRRRLGQLGPFFADDHTSTLRLFGARELGNGVGLLASPRSAGWRWGRVAGDVMDLAFLFSAARSSRADRSRVGAAMAAVLGVTVLDAMCAVRAVARRAVSRTVLPDGSIRVVKSVAINRPPAECYAFWRDFTNLPRIMRHLEAVRVSGDRRSHWTARAPGGTTVEWEAEIIEEQPNELIAWRSLRGADVDNEGSVRFEPSVKGDGTLVRIVLRYRPPAGRLGMVVAQLFGEEPEQQIGEDMRRFKQLIETGDIITTRGQPSGPPRWSLMRRVTAS